MIHMKYTVMLSTLMMITVCAIDDDAHAVRIKELEEAQLEMGKNISELSALFIKEAITLYEYQQLALKYWKASEEELDAFMAQCLKIYIAGEEIDQMFETTHLIDHQDESVALLFLIAVLQEYYATRLSIQLKTRIAELMSVNKEVTKLKG